MTKDLLFEIGTEEMPARFLPGSIEELEKIAQAKFSEALISFSKIKVYATPRRLALLVFDIAEVQTKQTVENKGPAVKIAYQEDGSLSKAALGFARGQGVAPTSLIEKDGYLYAVKELGGETVIDLLPQLLEDILNSLTFPKSMRWADLNFRFVRPIHWLVALFGEDIIPLEAVQVKSGRTSQGHRFLSKGAFALPAPRAYLEELKSNFVLADQDERRSLIKEQVTLLGRELGGETSIDEELLEEVVHLVEYPTALCGNFAKEFLSLPAEAIITPMREHQRYFPVLNKDGKLLPHFITVRNGGKHNLQVVAQGNERVLRARLSDAAFFFQEDQKQPLAARLEKLKSVVFQDGLGSIYDKTQRLRELAKFIAGNTELTEVDLKNLDRAAELSKADLVTGMVGEFAELQGIMGREYAKADGEAEIVAEGIFEHYLPRFAGDKLPQSFTGRFVGLADKIDNIMATFSRALIPTGSQDPYALRRQAIGIINILQAAKYNISLLDILNKSFELLAVPPAKKDILLSQIGEFFQARLRNILAEQGFKYDLIEAVLAAGIDDLADTFQRATALNEFARDRAKLSLLTQTLTRVKNITKEPLEAAQVEEALLSEEAEKVLYKTFNTIKKQTEKDWEQKEYLQVLNYTLELAEPINEFFENVMVMAKDEKIKQNRLALLQQIAEFSSRVADLSFLVEKN